MGKNKKTKPKKQAGSKAVHKANSASTARSSPENIQPCRRHMPSEGEASKTSTDTSVHHSESSPSPITEGAPVSEPVSQMETTSEAIEKPNPESQTTGSTNEAGDSAPVDEQSVATDSTSMDKVSLPGTTPSDDAAAPPEDAGEDPHSPSAEAQPESLVAAGDEEEASETESSTTLSIQPDEAKDESTGEDEGVSSQSPPGKTLSGAEVAMDDEALPVGFDTDMEMFLQMETNQETTQQKEDDNREDGVVVEGNSGINTAVREEDHAEENENVQGDPGTEHTVLPHIQKPSLFDEPQSQELQLKLEDALQAPMKLDPGSPQQGIQPAGSELQGLRSRRPSANNLTISVDKQTSPPVAAVNDRHRRTARDLLLQKGHLLAEDTQLSRTMTSVANYIDGVGGRPSSEELEEFEAFKTYTAQRAKLLEGVLEGEEEPLAAMRRFDERWRDKAIVDDDADAWGGTRQDLRLAAVRAALHFRHEYGSIQSEIAIMYFEHRVAGLRKRLGAEVDDPVALQTLDILGSSSAAAGNR
ncbi:hypothetical protein VMCG_09143 [Cytospora schulzeri]|uniref:Uncharacterized protein n=1 Tax=Cytospora schulzeri TaxID=448051 RepID=A0A423VMZ3_9PEZI|nr:hypothetical protein VMCG_09143 [Valsa malicola]